MAVLHEKAHSPPLEDWQTVEGQDGFDTLQFNGADIAEQITISANGERVLSNVVMDTNGVRDGVVKTAVTGVFVTVLIVVLVLDVAL